MLHKLPTRNSLKSIPSAVFIINSAAPINHTTLGAGEVQVDIPVPLHLHKIAFTNNKYFFPPAEINFHRFSLSCIFFFFVWDLRVLIHR